MGILKTRGLEAKFELQNSVVHALRGIDLDVEEGEFFVLLGPSGCGKTTMLRSIAGLERPSAGEISIDNKEVVRTNTKLFVPPDQRPIAMVFQNYAIWPHMDVFENIAFPLRRGRTKLGEAAVRERVSEVLEMLGLGSMAERPVITLSGGQQQRVALARALALRPRVLLMDEPLSNLDFKLQVRLRAQMRDLMHRLRLTTVHVTHNQAEALETGDRIAVMEQGKIVQLGDPRTIYHRPENEFVARFIGDMNIFSAIFQSKDAQTVLVDTPFGKISGHLASHTSFKTGDRCVIGIRPEDIEISVAENTNSTNQISATVVSSSFVGEGFVYTIEAFDQRIRIKRHHNEVINPGEKITILFPPNQTIVVTPAEDLEAEDLEGGLTGEGASIAG